MLPLWAAPFLWAALGLALCGLTILPGALRRRSPRRPHRSTRR